MGSVDEGVEGMNGNDPQPKTICSEAEVSVRYYYLMQLNGCN